MRKVLPALIGFLILVGVGAGAAHYFVPPYNPGFAKHPIVTVAHVLLGPAYLFFGGLQFVPRIRNTWPAYHRWAGRVLVVLASIVGLSALFLALFVPFAGWTGRIVNGFFGIFFLFALARGVIAIRRREVTLHREWMIRAFAIALGIATMRLIFIPALLIAGDDANPVMLSAVAFTAAFVSHALAAEFWIRKTRRPVNI